MWLLDGEYPVSIRLADRVTGTVIDWREAVATFEVVNEGRAEGTVALDVTIRRDAAVTWRRLVVAPSTANEWSARSSSQSYNSPAVSHTSPPLARPPPG